MSTYKYLNSDFFLIIFIWLAITLLNSNKAYHIDDSFHLIAAEKIIAKPSKPMSGLIIWGNTKTPLYKHNQPPLFFYLIGLTSFLLDRSEITTHLLIAIFSFISLLYFYKLLILFDVKNKRTLLILLGFCPAFLVNQNLMTDIPILAITLLVFYYFLLATKTETTKHYILSLLFLGLGLLIKYTLLPLILTIICSLILTKKYKRLIFVLIPISILGLWSLWNYSEYNAIHIIDRPKLAIGPKQIIAFFGTIGSVCFFSFSYWFYYAPTKRTRLFISTSIAIFWLTVPLIYFKVIPEVLFNRILNFIFIINGLFLAVVLLKESYKYIIKQKQGLYNSNQFQTLLFLIPLATFIALFAPFNATRHTLLLIPFLLLFTDTLFNKPRGLVNNLVIITSITIGSLLGISDWIYADFYRKKAKELKADNNEIWSIGLWGWQWYSKKNGMKIYSLEEKANIKKGDLIIFPKDVPKQHLDTLIKTDTIKSITETPNFLTFFSGKNFASMYNSFYDKPAWTLSNTPIDSIFICKVIENPYYLKTTN